MFQDCVVLGRIQTWDIKMIFATDRLKYRYKPRGRRCADREAQGNDEIILIGSSPSPLAFQLLLTFVYINQWTVWSIRRCIIKSFCGCNLHESTLKI